MRYSAIIKFFAVILCAAVLIAAVGSGIGLLALTECGLYSRSFEDFYSEDIEDKAQFYGRQVAGRYASLNLGGADKQLANDFYPVSYAFFEPNRVGYVLKDGDGTVLQTQELSPYTAQQTIEVKVGGRYMKVLKTEPMEETVPVPSEPANLLIHTLPTENTVISYVSLDFADGTLEQHELPENGYLEVIGEGLLRLTSDYLNSPGLNEGKTLSFITLLDGDRRIAYEAYGANGLLLGYNRQDGQTLLLLPGNPYETVPESATPRPGTTITNGDFAAYDAIPENGAVVSQMNVSYGTPEEGTTASESVGGDNLGFLLRDKTGNPRFDSNQTGLLDIPEDVLITSITFLDERGGLLYEANCPNGVGTFSRNEKGHQVFVANTPGLAVPEETAPANPMPEAVEVTRPTTEETIRGVVLRDTDVYSMPSLSGKTAIWLKAGTEVTVLQRESISDANWARIDLGWIRMEDLVLEQSAGPEETPEAEPEEEAVQAIAVGDAVIYAMPNEEKPVGEVKKGDTVTVLKQESYGGKVWVLTDTGWIQMEYLTVVTPVPAAEEELAVRVTSPVISGVFVPKADSVDVKSGETASAETIHVETVPETTPAETVPEAIPEEQRKMAPAALVGEDPLAGYDSGEIQTQSYYDPEQQQSMQVWYVMEPMPDYTLELQLAPGADRTEMLWMLLWIAYALRDYLLMILGGSLALLGLCVVYLCCASAHKRGSDVIRAGGLNRIPLDGYLVLVGCLLTGLVLLGYEGTEYFIQNGLKQIGLGLLVGSAYVCSLLLVGFGFAFVAQIKTPGGFWWRNSLCGRVILLTVHLCQKTVIYCGSGGWTLVKRFFRWLQRFCIALFLFGKKTVLRLWDVGKRLWLWAWDLFGRGFHWISGNLARLFGLLPITWQFLATGFVLVVLLYVMMRTYKVGYILLGFGIFFAVILYAASAFAILLESAKRMSKGDLDTKVDDRMLIGGFREFAQRLNDLAGVAVVAAQKQLKSERMKTELITNVSHDIKTPLTSIINYVDLLQKPHTEEQQAQYLEVLDRQSQRLKKLIDDLMEMSKASTGNLSVDIEKVDASEAVNQALGEFADKLERAQLLPVFRQPEDPVYMMADGRLVWRVMSNILGNAVKYALPGTRVYLDLMEMDGKVVISMKNISREELNVNAEELMERFVRGDASRNTEGSGLGLNIAQSLMELQRGQLQVLVDGDLFKVTLIFPGA